MRIATLSFPVLPLLAASACSGDSTPPADLLGTWLDRNDRNGEVVAEVTFDADGTLTVRSSVDGTASVGTFEVEGDRLELDIEIDGDRIAYSAGYHTDGEILLVPAFLPVGSVDRFVGVWRNELAAAEGIEPAEQAVDTVTLAADGSATRSVTRDGDPDGEFTGTWTEAAGWITVELGDGDDTRTYFGLPGDALAHDPLFRPE